YWKYLRVRHALDVMHIEKNVCDSIIGTLLEIPGKNKDGIAARLDLLNMGSKLICNPSMEKDVLVCLLGLGICQKQRRERFAILSM
ncbi:PREDICTED: transposon, partial [Prunus dulcis]